jgi:hypothetical protein
LVLAAQAEVQQARLVALVGTALVAERHHLVRLLFSAHEGNLLQAFIQRHSTHMRVLYGLGLILNHKLRMSQREQ